MSVYMPHVFKCPRGQEDAGCSVAAQCGCQKQNLGPLEKCQALLTTELSLHPHENIFTTMNDLKYLFLNNVAEEQISQNFHFQKGMADKLKIQTDKSQKPDLNLYQQSHDFKQ